MLIDKNTKQVMLGNTEIKRIMSEGGVLWEKSIVPGPSKLIGGNLQAGFYGEVPTSDFITGDELARKIGLAAGVSQFSDEPWLKFSYLGNVEFVAKKPFRYSISWNNINAANAVFGNRTIKVGDNTYKIRLMKGKTEGKQNDSSSDRGDINKGSEWNKLMLPIHRRAPSSWIYRNNVNIPTENWNIGYTDNDLATIGDGSYSWCQELGSLSSYRLYRGNSNITGSGSADASDKAVARGWRPVLELVNEEEE